MKMQFYVIPVKHDSLLNVTILIILITNIYKVVTNHSDRVVLPFLYNNLVPRASFH